ncbi:carboxypeptidase-like regulatory domain-containing protein [Maribacter dokdonensis]|uniref:carboxypeptidase-like regulatory domain-containing protein n=1 Tax=Maribacter dokdonensis TaxID=320912 RepID=UPI0027345C61|nr:carboxypeptidase-like regulatory domain-containing protein [Maribacter dokdonensis]MDP2525264.1 carboxypeptidase-like regulatory domain-containing protein [Maribacter dokdonensis]
MRTLLIIFLLIFGTVHAQEVLVEGHVLDEKTKTPVPYANVSFLKTLKGTSSDEDGYFYIDVPESYLEREVHISALGFKDTIIPAKIISQKKKIHLKEETFELEEVVVSQSLGDSQVLNPVSSYSIKSGFSSAETPWVLALYFPNIGASKKFIEKITIHVQQNSKFKRASSKFRLRVYDVDKKTQKPNNDLIRKSIILESSKTEDFVSIDLSSMNIKMPDEGIYIGLEWLFLPYNWYTNTYKHAITNKKVVEDRFAPTFAAVYQKNQNFKTMVYGMGEWSDFAIKAPGNNENLIPAVSLKLSKKR